MVVLWVPGTDHPRGNTPSRPRAWVSLETIQLLWMESQREGFWPGVCSLKCNIGWEIVPFISLFLTPTIADLDLTLPHEDNRFLQPTLSLLTHTCRQLRSLRMDIDTSASLSGDGMGRLISASRHTLHRLNIRSPTPPEIFPVIFNLPQLRRLTLQGPQLPNQIPSEISPPLEAIDFTSTHSSNLTQFLRRFSRLMEVSIHCAETIQVSAVLGSLRGAGTTMNSLYLSPVPALDDPSITLLCTFTNLTFLRISCACEVTQPCSIQLTDEDVFDLGGALPHIRALNLAPGCHTPPDVTFASLILLSRTCSNLVYLAIKVDFESIVDLDLSNEDKISLGDDKAHSRGERSRLHTLLVGNSSLPDTPRCEWMVALALATIFPSVEHLFSYHGGGMHKRWNEVWGNILICQEIFRVTRGGGKR